MSQPLSQAAVRFYVYETDTSNQNGDMHYIDVIAVIQELIL